MLLARLLTGVDLTLLRVALLRLRRVTRPGRPRTVVLLTQDQPDHQTDDRQAEQPQQHEWQDPEAATIIGLSRGVVLSCRVFTGIVLGVPATSGSTSTGRRRVRGNGVRVGNFIRVGDGDRIAVHLADVGLDDLTWETVVHGELDLVGALCVHINFFCCRLPLGDHSVDAALIGDGHVVRVDL